MKRSILFSSVLAVVVLLSSCLTEAPVTEIAGCTNPASLNYNPYANTDDGTCVFVEQRQRALLGDHSATWCGYCGSWGLPDFTTLNDTYGEDAVSLNMHPASSDLGTAWTEVVMGNYMSAIGGSGYPTLACLNSASNGKGNAASLPGVIDAALAETSVVNSHASGVVNGGNLDITVQTYFFDNHASEVNLAVYIVENGIVNNQSGHADGANTVHPHVLRASANGDFGESLGTSFSANETFNNTYSVALDPSWDPANLELVVVMSDPADSYLAVNADHGAVN